MFTNLNNSKKILLLSTLVFMVALSVGFSNYASSSQLDNISGYGWESDKIGSSEAGGMGWLSLNCISGGNCGSVNYGLNLNNSTGEIKGYGWSPHYGWVKFGDLANFPTGGGTSSVNAKLVGNNVIGWARFCSAAANPETCSGTSVQNLSTGGWDGWISLRGSTPDYGVNLNISNGTGAFSGYAWGGNKDTLGNNTVGIGWIDFSNGVYTEITQPTVTISANPINIPDGSSTTINWTGISLLSGQTSCTATGNWSGQKPYPAPTAGYNTGPLSTGSYIYSIQCVGADGVTNSNVSSVTVNVGGTTILDFYAIPSPTYPPYNTKLFWRALPSPDGISNCVASSDSPLNIKELSTWNPTIPILPPDSSNPVRSADVNAPYNPTNYKITCNDSLGQPISAIVSVPQGTLPESVTLSSDKVTGTSPNYFTTMRWQTVNVYPNSCHPSSSVPSWNSPDPKLPASSGSQANVVVPATAPGFTTYTLTCTGLFTNKPISVSILLNEGSDKKSNRARPKYTEQ